MGDHTDLVGGEADLQITHPRIRMTVSLTATAVLEPEHQGRFASIQTSTLDLDVGKLLKLCAHTTNLVPATDNRFWYESLCGQ